MRRMMLVVLATWAMFAAGCKAYQAPEQVQGAAVHQLQDLVAIEAELLPFVPDDAQLPYKTVTGESAVMNARELWKGRLRAMMFRMAGLVAWSRGEPYDEEAAFAKLFPDRVGAVEDGQ